MPVPLSGRAFWCKDLHDNNFGQDAAARPRAADWLPLLEDPGTDEVPVTLKSSGIATPPPQPIDPEDDEQDAPAADQDEPEDLDFMFKRREAGDPWAK